MSKGDDEAEVIWCSAAFDRDKKGCALEFLVCPNCRAKDAQAAAKQEFDMEVARRKKWVEERQALVDKVIGHEVVHIKTRHFTLSSDLTSVKVGLQAVAFRPSGRITRSYPATSLENSLGKNSQYPEAAWVVRPATSKSSTPSTRPPRYHRRPTCQRAKAYHPLESRRGPSYRATDPGSGGGRAGAGG